ncbi:hypothetical protein GGX14DRAFT_661435 [Mycena pura]|uniref:PH domain-containing protein n=1 Tax=Mycena pura TaxID=153505 RepID=A0AAD6V7X1_9AGAR|nr:hypothetical protein GGX14DRAFT_661435 [Mycena pura]
MLEQSLVRWSYAWHYNDSSNLNSINLERDTYDNHSASHPSMSGITTFAYRLRLGLGGPYALELDAHLRLQPPPRFRAAVRFTGRNRWVWGAFEEKPEDRRGEGVPATPNDRNKKTRTNSRARVAVLRQGPVRVKKRGPWPTNWFFRVQWVELREMELEIYSRSSSLMAKTSRTRISLCDIDGVERSSHIPFGLALKTKAGKRYLLSFESDSELYGWLDDISLRSTGVSRPFNVLHNHHATFDPVAGILRGLPLGWEELLCPRSLKSVTSESIQDDLESAAAVESAAAANMEQQIFLSVYCSAQFSAVIIAASPYTEIRTVLERVCRKLKVHPAEYSLALADHAPSLAHTGTVADILKGRRQLLLVKREHKPANETPPPLAHTGTFADIPVPPEDRRQLLLVKREYKPANETPLQIYLRISPDEIYLGSVSVPSSIAVPPFMSFSAQDKPFQDDQKLPSGTLCSVGFDARFWFKLELPRRPSQARQPRARAVRRQQAGAPPAYSKRAGCGSGLAFDASTRKRGPVRVKECGLTRNWFFKVGWLELTDSHLALHPSANELARAVILKEDIVKVERTNVGPYTLILGTKSKQYLLTLRNDNDLYGDLLLVVSAVIDKLIANRWTSGWYDAISDWISRVGHPFNFNHNVHVRVNPEDGTYGGLPDEWRKWLGYESPIQPRYHWRAPPTDVPEDANPERILLYVTFNRAKAEDLGYISTSVLSVTPDTRIQDVLERARGKARIDDKEWCALVMNGDADHAPLALDDTVADLQGRHDLMLTNLESPPPHYI